MNNFKNDDSAKSVENQLFGGYSHPSNGHVCLKHFESYDNQDFNLVPLKRRAKVPLVRGKGYRLTIGSANTLVFSCLRVHRSFHINLASHSVCYLANSRAPPHTG